MAHNRGIFLSDRHDPSPVLSARRGAHSVGPEGAAVLQLHLALAVLCGTTITLVWAATGNGDFWPLWVWLVLGAAFATHAGVRWAVVAYPPGRNRRLAIHVVVSVVAAALILAAPSGNGFGLAAAGYFLVGFGPMLWLICQTTVRQLVTPSALMGRVNATVQTAIYGVRPLGALAGGLVAAQAGLHAALLLIAVAFAMSTAVIVLSPLARLRVLPSPATG